MRAYDTYQNELRPYGYLPAWINYGLAYENDVALHRMFTFSGFGSNDPRRKRGTGTGQFTKLHEVQLRGSIPSPVGNVTYRYREINKLNGLPFQDIVSGVTDPARFDIMLVNPGGLDPDLKTRVYNEALTKIYEKLRNSNVNLAVSAGEASETARMWKHALRALKKIEKSAKGLKRQLLHKPSLLLSSGWLMYKYGWLPHVTDVYNYVNHNISLRQKLQLKSRRALTFPVNKVVKDANGVRVDRTSGSYSIRCEIGIDVVVTSETAYELGRLTSLNPLSVAWELTPLSFVVDWFVDISSYLQNMEASMGYGLAFENGYITYTSLSDLKWMLSGYQRKDINYYGPPGYAITEYGGSASRRMATKERYVLNGLPRPTLPTLTTRLGSQRIISAAALLRTILLGRH